MLSAGVIPHWLCNDRLYMKYAESLFSLILHTEPSINNKENGKWNKLLSLFFFHEFAVKKRQEKQIKYKKAQNTPNPNQP